MPSPRTRKPKPILSGKRDHPRSERIGSHTIFGRSPIQFRAAKRIIAGESRRKPSISPTRRSISAKRTEERREGNECVSTGRSRWWPEQYKKKIIQNTTEQRTIKIKRHE